MILVHGYGLALERDHQTIPINGNFLAFDPEIREKKAYPFLWSLPYPRQDWTPYDLLEQQTLYDYERQYIREKRLQERLKRCLWYYQPRMIIAHSLGGYLVRNVVNNFPIPQSLETIALLQADIPQSIPLPYLPQVQWMNFWCWWDVPLSASQVINKEPSIGLVGSNQWHVTNIFQAIQTHAEGHKRLLYDTDYKQHILARIN